MDDFESFTREKIARLRAEADALEKSLKEFVGSKARQAGASRRSGGDQPRAGAFGVVLQAIAGAGDAGLSLDDMVAAAEAEGYEVKRATLRAQVWKAKEDGALIQMEPGRYKSPFAGVQIDDPDDSEEGGYSGGGFTAAPRSQPPGPREKPPADLDDEIPF